MKKKAIRTNTEVEFGVSAVDNSITTLFANVSVFHSQFDRSNVTF